MAAGRLGMEKETRFSSALSYNTRLGLGPCLTCAEGKQGTKENNGETKKACPFKCGRQTNGFRSHQSIITQMPDGMGETCLACRILRSLADNAQGRSNGYHLISGSR